MNAPATRPAHLFVSDCDGALYDTRHPDWSRAPLRAVYAQTHRRINSGAEFRATLRAGRYCFPGGYELFFSAADGGALCFGCARENAFSVLHSIRSNTRDGWRVVGTENSADMDGGCACDHCGAWLSAYSDGPDDTDAAD